LLPVMKKLDERKVWYVYNYVCACQESPVWVLMYISLCLRLWVIHFSVENSKFIFCACTVLANHTSMLSNSSPCSLFYFVSYS
jgi:hypothetical protein